MPRRLRKIPVETFENNVLEGTVREYPSVDCLTNGELKILESRTRKLRNFEESARLPFEAVDLVSEMLTAASGFEERKINDKNGYLNKQKYFFRDPWEQTSMIVVKEGREPLKNGFNLILCHSDSPCLRLKSKPIRLEWDSDKIYNYLGIRLTAVTHGGTRVHQWMGRDVTLLGYTVDKKGNRDMERKIELPGVVGDWAAHVDYRDAETVSEAFAKDSSLEIIPGFTSQEELLKRLDFESVDDFSNSKIFAVPVNIPRAIDEYSWRLLTGPRHDDLCCTHAALDAIVKARNPKKTSIVWITDNEEIGDSSPTGASGSFLDLILDYIIRKQNGHKHDLSSAERRMMYFHSCMLIGDVSVAPYGQDYEDMDVKNAPKVGLGVYISGDGKETSHSGFVAKLRNLARKGISTRNNICHQICGYIYHQDREDVSYSMCDDGKNSLNRKVGQWAWVGVPCASTHSHSEIICPADEMWASKMYRNFFQSDLSLE